jgi:histone H3
VKAIREIRYYQQMDGFIIPKLPFQRLVREITYNVSANKEYRFQATAIAVLQEAAEAHLVAFFEGKSSSFNL